MSQKNTPSKNQITFQANAALVTSLGTMQPTQLPNIAPAPQQGGAHSAMTQQPGQPAAMPHPMAPTTPQGTHQPGGQVMASSMGQAIPAQVGQPLPTGQFQVLHQQPYGAAPAGTTQYVQPFATYNQQGQLVLQQGSFALPGGMQVATQQPGQQQFILTAAPNQKPGQPTQMIASPVPANQAVKTPMSQSYTLSSNALVQGTTAGTPQAFMIAANPMGNMTAANPQGQAIATSMGSQMKQIDQKPPITVGAHQQLPQSPVGQAQQPTSGTPNAAQSQQPLMLPQGMTYMNPPQGQAYLQNGQLIFRPAAPQDPSQQVMFSPNGQLTAQQTATGHMQLQQQPQMSGTSLATGNMQPVVSMMSTSVSNVRPASNSLPMQPPPPGKTAISRSLAPLLPTSTLSTRPTTYMPPGMTTPSSQPSPKSKQKMSPRGSGAPIGRPPGPAKSALNALKSSNNASMSPPRLPGSPGQPATQLLGPPVLQASSQQGSTVLTPQSSQGVKYSQPPLLQPMLPPPPPAPTTSSTATMISSASDSSSNKTTTTTTVSSASTTSTLPPISSLGPNKTDSIKDEESKVDGKGQQTLSGSQQLDNGLTPKAVVKPNVLTHLIDGHVIMESSEPFPVDREDKGNKIPFFPTKVTKNRL